MEEKSEDLKRELRMTKWQLRATKMQRMYLKCIKMANPDSKVLLIIKREKPEPHYEIHFDKHVEFRNLQGEKIGESKVEPNV